jgi:glyoxylase-like metal-dependent hydrolase (beta-lactamase superfamily II)
MTWRRGLRTLTAAGAALWLLASCVHRTDEAQAVLQEADRAMGGAALKTLTYSASGTGASFGQAYQPGMAWPRINISAFSRIYDYENGAMREDATRARAEPTGGSGLPLAGEQRTTALVRGDFAWNLAGPAAVAAPVAMSSRRHDLWTSPHGIVKAGLRSQATLRREGDKRVVAFSEAGHFSAVVRIGADGMVERVDSVLPNPVTGDTQTVTLYSGYRDFAGVRFPTRIRQNQGGFPVLDLEVREVQANPPAGIEVPALVQAFAERVVADKVADGVWFLAGGSHNSVLIEMKDHLILVESPLYDGRAQAVLAEAKKLVPGKPVRYAINSHHHFDHSGGLRAAAAEGATLVVSEQARPWFERTMARPNSVSPDALAKSGAKVTVMGVDSQRTFSDGARIVEVFMIEDSVHAQGFMMVWLPRERLLVQADGYTPGAPGSPAPAQPDANNVNLAQNIDRLRLNVERILPLHGRVVPLAELHTAIGRKP